MMRRFSLLLLYLFVFSSCSDKYYKSKNNPHTVSYRGQRTVVETKKPTHIELTQRTKALVEAQSIQKDFTEDDFHEVPPPMRVTEPVTREYIQKYKDIAMIEMMRYKIPASITLAQGILESASGQGRLARHGKNHFGIKCHATWNGKTITHDDDEKRECFRKYDNEEQSFEDHSTFLNKRGRYSFLFDLLITDYEAWAHGLKKAGYATDPAYARKLIALIQKFNLHQYDLQVVAEMKESSLTFGSDIVSTPTPKLPQNTTTPQPDDTAIAKKTVTRNTTPKTEVKETPKPTEKEIAKTIERKETPKQQPQKQEPSKNLPPKKTEVAVTPPPAVKDYYEVQTGDTLYKIAREQQVPVKQLMKLNNLDDLSSSNLRVGQQIRIN